MQNLVRSKTIGVTENGGRRTAGAGPGRDLLLVGTETVLPSTATLTTNGSWFPWVTGTGNGTRPGVTTPPMSRTARGYAGAILSVLTVGE